jgi:hypothetical protein
MMKTSLKKRVNKRAFKGNVCFEIRWDAGNYQKPCGNFRMQIPCELFFSLSVVFAAFTSLAKSKELKVKQSLHAVITAGFLTITGNFITSVKN